MSSALEAKSAVEAILFAMTELETTLEPHSLTSGVRRSARLLFEDVWAPLHRTVLDLQPGERVRFHCGEGNDALRSDGWRDVIYVGPIEHDQRYAAIRETWESDNGKCSGWVEWTKLDRPAS